MRIFGGERILKVMDRLKVADDMPIQNRTISKSLEGAQKKVEGFNFDMRKNVVQYDDVMNRHRRATYNMRKEILHRADIHKRVKEFMHSEAHDLANSPVSMTKDFDNVLQDIFPLDTKTLNKLFDLPADKFEEELKKSIDALYEEQEERFGDEILRKVERDVYLQTLDNYWMQHLENMDHLREGIHWMGVGQRDPLVEYRTQSQRLFEEMQLSLRHDVIKMLLNARPVSPDQLDRPLETELTRAARASVDNADQIVDAEEFHEEDFAVTEQSQKTEQAKKKKSIKKSRKKERQNKKKAKKRRK